MPDSMNTEHYIYGTEVVNGHDAWALFSAAVSGDLARVQTLVDRDPALVNVQYWYQFPLHLAAKEGHTAVVQYLLEHGAELGKSRYMYNSWDKLLAEVNRRGHLAVKELIESTLKQRFNYQPEFDAMRDAIHARQRETVETLLTKKPELATGSDAFGNTGLHWATLTRQTQLIDRFLELGVSIDAKRADGQTPIMLSINGDYWYRWNRNLPKEAMNNQWIITGYLLARGAAVTLGIACAVADQGQVENILKSNNLAANKLDDQGASPLYHAVRSGQLKIVEILLKHGADPNQPEHNAPVGRALHEAASKNNLDMIRMLLEAGANPNGDVDSSGNVLHISRVKSPNNCEEVQELLRAHGGYKAPYDLSDEELKEAIHTHHPVLQDSQIIQEILSRDHPEIIDAMLSKHNSFISRILPGNVYGGTIPARTLTQKLIDHGLDVNKPNWIGRTFLHSCVRKGQIDAAEALLDAGANIDAIELENGGTTLAEAVREGQIEMVKCLLGRGANPNAPEGFEWATAKATAERQNDPEMKKLFA